LLRHAQAVEGVGLAAQVAEIAAQRQGLLRAGGGRVVPGQHMYQTQFGEGGRLHEAVADAAG